MTSALLDAASTAAAQTSPPRCLYCGGRDLRRAYSGVRDRLGYVPGEREFWQCRNCGSLVLVPLPRPEELAAFYPPVYTFRLNQQRSGWRGWLAAAEYSCFYRPQYAGQVRLILRAIRRHPPPGRSLLDVGCGPGLRLLEFRSRGWEVRGFDLQPEVIRYLRGSLGIPGECGDISALTQVYGPESFDLVTAFFMLEHVPDVVGTLRDLWQVLRPGGWLAAAVPLADSIQSRCFGAAWSAVTEAPRHLSLPSRPGLLRAAERAGFSRRRVVADELLSCSSSLSLSLIPAGNLANASARGAWLGTASRLLAGLAAVVSTPWVWVENHAFRRPAHGLLMARKPSRDQL